MLQAAAAQPGSHTVASLYALAVIDAEGGHYEQAVHHAQAALQAAETNCQPGGHVAPIVALLALLLSARCVWGRGCGSSALGCGTRRLCAAAGC